MVSIHDPEFKLRSFCTMFHIDSNCCADKQFSFAQNFNKFNLSLLLDENEDEEEQDSDLDSLIDSSSESEDHDDSYGNGDKICGGVPDEKEKSSFLEVLRILLHPDYHLVDAFPILCQVHAIAVAIPISSATAEQSFSALTRVKTCTSLSMSEERLEALLLMAIERKILKSLDNQQIITTFEV